jgi:cation transport regulator ChaB
MRVSKDDLDKARRERNVEFLLRVVRTNSDLPQEVRDYLADILGDLINRKIKRPAHRPAKSETLIRRQRIATRALEIEENAARKKMSQSVAEVAAGA